MEMQGEGVTRVPLGQPVVIHHASESRSGSRSWFSLVACLAIVNVALVAACAVFASTYLLLRLQKLENRVAAVESVLRVKQL